MHAVVFAYDATREDGLPGRRRLLFDAPPQTGDVVLIVDGVTARLTIFDEAHAPRHPVWIVAVVRLTATLMLLAAIC